MVAETLGWPERKSVRCSSAMSCKMCVGITLGSQGRVQFKARLSELDRYIDCEGKRLSDSVQEGNKVISYTYSLQE